MRKNITHPRRQTAGGLGLGIALGVTLGAALDNIALGLGIGILLGCLGVLLKRNRS